jgi:hypothetical protein
MKYTFLFAFIIVGFLSCKQEKETRNFSATNVLTEAEIDAFKYEIIRYAGKLAGRANHQTKFEERFDAHYIELAGNHQLPFYYVNEETGEIYFLLTRIAPSIHYRKVAVGGKLTRDDFGEITYYEETFRTWKMEENELLEKSQKIFSDYVDGKDLSKYYPENSGGEEYIEFPNEEVYYDNEQRIWISLRENPMQYLYEGGNETVQDTLNQ